jgi:transposase
MYSQLSKSGATPPENDQLKRLTRRRRQRVNDKVRVVNRLQSDLQAVCPGLLEITGAVDNLWFLRFLTCREELPKLARLHRSSLLQVPGIGQKYADEIQRWQGQAHFAPEVAWVGPMILEDARRILEFLTSIQRLDERIAALAEHSDIAQRIDSIPGFGPTGEAPSLPVRSAPWSASPRKRASPYTWAWRRWTTSQASSGALR